MPIYDVICDNCGKTSEVIISSQETTADCPACGKPGARRLISATSTLTGRAAKNLPGPSDTGCCGSTPGHAGCAGPGTCCGKAG